MPRKIAAAPLCVLGAALAACGPNWKTISRYVAQSPHGRIAVLPFTPAPGQPNSGQEVADLFSEQLQNLGFVLVNREDLKKVLEEEKLSLTGLVRGQDAARLGELLGARAVLTGTVAEFAGHQVVHPAVYINGTTNVWDRSSKKYKQVPVKSLLWPRETAQVVVFAVTARLTDVETGALLWVSSGSDHAEAENLQDVAARVLRKMARALANKYFERRL